MNIEQPYLNVFGFVPEMTQKRHAFTKEVFPEILDIQEEFRRRCMNSGVLEEKTTHLILFAMLASHMRDGARVHAISSRKLGTSWKELHATANLVFLFAGLSAMNFAIRILDDVKKLEEEKNKA